MFSRIIKRWRAHLLALLILFLILPVPALAADLSSGITITDTDSNLTKNSETSVTIKATRERSGSAGTKTNTITVLNSSGGKATIDFDYTVSGHSDFSIDSRGTKTDTHYSITLENNASFTILLSAYAEKWKTSTATLRLTNITLTPIPDASNVTFLYDESLGIVKTGSTTIVDGTTKTVTSDGISLTATAVSGAEFVAWTDGNNKVLYTESSYTLMPPGDMTIKAAFSDGTPFFFVENNENTYLIEGFDAAVTYAQSATGKVISLANNATVASGDYTIPSGITLLVPFNVDNTCYIGAPVAEYGDSTPEPYRTLTMSEGANIIVNGAMSVSAKIQAAGAGSPAGKPKGLFGHVSMNEGSSITVNSDASLSVFGYITGYGTVTANSGASVYETFQIMDFRGGTATLGMHGLTGSGNDGDVFPLSQYYVQNIEVPLTLHAGATETAYAALYMSNMVVDTTVKFVASSGAMFNLTNGYVTKRYDKATDRLIIDGYGDVSINNISFDIVIDLYITKQTYTINSRVYILPLTSSITLNINSGTVTISQDMSFLPGTQVFVGEEATVKLASGVRLFVYDSDSWVLGNFVYSGKKLAPVDYVYKRAYTRTAADLVDSKVTVAGTIDASAGTIYTTESGGEIVGIDGGKVIITTGSETVTYQATQSGTDITYVNIPVITAKLKNENEEYVSTTTDTYYYAHHDCTHGNNESHGVWWPAEHTETAVVTEPTCESTGYTTYICVCGHSFNSDVVAATGHSYGEWVLTTRPTGSTKGIETKTCSKCGDKQTREVIAVAQTTIADGTEMYCISLQEAIENTSDNFITMLADTTESTYMIDKAVTIDLNGKNVTLTKDTTIGTLCGMDSTTNAYSADEAGKITVNGEVNIPLLTKYQPDTSIAPKYYVKVVNDDGYSFHRAGVSVTGIQYTLNTDYAVFQGVFRGTDDVATALKDVGFRFNESTDTWYNLNETDIKSDGIAFSYARKFADVTSVQALLSFDADHTTNNVAVSMLRSGIADLIKGAGQ